MSVHSRYVGKTGRNICFSSMEMECKKGPSKPSLLGDPKSTKTMPVIKIAKKGPFIHPSKPHMNSRDESIIRL